MWINSDSQYGWVAIALHWLTAAIVIGLFGIGLWMVSLDYYHPWYTKAPDLHRSMGVLLALLVVSRLVSRWFMPMPKPVEGVRRWEHIAAVVVHRLMYVLLITTIILGYLISTADGRPIDVFGWFKVPATVTSIPQQADLAGELHLYFAVTLIVLAGVHVLAALKHHFINRDVTLLRMFGLKR